MVFEIQVSTLLTSTGDRCQVFRRTQSLRTSFIHIHTVSPHRWMEPQTVFRSTMGKSVYISKQFCGIPALVGPYQCSLQYLGQGKSFSVTENNMHLSGRQRCHYSPYHPKSISPLVCCHFSLWLFDSLLNQMLVKKNSTGINWNWSDTDSGMRLEVMFLCYLRYSLFHCQSKKADDYFFHSRVTKKVK